MEVYLLKHFTRLLKSLDAASPKGLRLYQEKLKQLSKAHVLFNGYHGSILQICYGSFTQQLWPKQSRLGPNKAD